MNPIIQDKVPYCTGDERCPRWNKPNLCWAFRKDDICKIAVQTWFDQLLILSGNLIGQQFENAKKPALPEKKWHDVCLWVHESDLYSTSCGKEFVFDSGTPGENGFKVCPFCGNNLATY